MSLSGGWGEAARGLLVHCYAVLVLGIIIIIADAQTCLLHAAQPAAAGHASCCDSMIWRPAVGWVHLG